MSKFCNKVKDDLLLIDYEYSCYNFFGFDIINYFIESFFNLSYPEYPFYCLNEKDFSKIFDDKSYFNCYLDYVYIFLKSDILSNNEKEYYSDIIKSKEYYIRIICVGSLFWSLVAFASIDIEGIYNKKSFDFIEYSFSRLEFYRLGKERIINKHYI